MPSIDAFNHAVDHLLQSLKYLKLNEYILKRIIGLLEFLWKVLKYIFGKSSSAEHAPVGTKIILGLIIFVILGVTILFVVLMLIRKKRKKKVKSILGEKIDKNSTVLSFLEKSKVFEEEGQYRQAVRLHFIAVLFYLHQNHILYHDTTMTGLEMIDKLNKDGYKKGTVFEGLVHQFNTVWYGMEEIGEEEFKAWQVKEEAFWQEGKK